MPLLDNEADLFVIFQKVGGFHLQHAVGHKIAVPMISLKAQDYPPKSGLLKVSHAIRSLSDWLHHE
jgi:hypothetical protein